MPAVRRHAARQIGAQAPRRHLLRRLGRKGRRGAARRRSRARLRRRARSHRGADCQGADRRARAESEKGRDAMTLLLSVTIKIALLTAGRAGRDHPAASSIRGGPSLGAGHRPLFACVCIPPMELLLPAWPIPLPAAWSARRPPRRSRFVSDAERASPVVAAAARTPSRARAGSPLPRLASVLASVWFAGAGRWRWSPRRRALRGFERLAAARNWCPRGPWRDIADEVSRSLRYPPTASALLCCRHPTMLATWGLARSDDSAARGSAGLGRGSRACRPASRVGPRRARRLGRDPDGKPSAGPCTGSTRCSGSHTAD